MQLTTIQQVIGTIELVSGLHIGSGNTEMHIGGTDNPVIKNPVSNEPYIPGSSIKGKMRSLMEWKAGVFNDKGGPLSFRDYGSLEGEQKQRAAEILQLFGGAPQSESDENDVKSLGVTRLSFWDCNLNPEWVKEVKEKNLLLTEVKMENSINRISGTADNPRNTERVPAGAKFDFKLSVRVHDEEDMLEPILTGLRLLELTGLGGSGSRGYGKIRFLDLKWGDEPLGERLAAVSL